MSANPPAPRVSVVVPTFRRPVHLMRCAVALFAQRLPRDAYEVIVVDDGCEDAIRTLVLELAAQDDAPTVRYLRPQDAHGPAAARNVGWRAARAPLIAFTDDDTIPDPEWLAAGEQAMARHPEWSAMAGRVEVPRAGGERRRPSDHERMTQGLATAEFVTANAFVRREALERICGFDERFTRAWREDSDLHFRLMRDVGPIGRSDAARVQHPVRRAPWGVCLRQQRNTYFDALLYKKHPKLYRQRIRPVPPWDYYAIVALAAASVPTALSGATGTASAVLGVAGALVLRFAAQRLRGADRSPKHVLEMLVTSALIPFLSVYWRLRGAIRFRVLFL